MILATVRIALQALRRNKVRSGLTMLGVVIGTSAVIATVSIGQSATASVTAQLGSMGHNLLIVMPGSSTRGPTMVGTGSAQTLTALDARSIEEQCPSALAASVCVRARAHLVRENRNWAPATVIGCEPDYLLVRDWGVDDGLPFTEADVRSAGQVCLVGRTVVEELFDGGPAVGERIRIKNLSFRVVGVLAAKGANAFGQDQDDVVLLPWTTCRKKVQGSTFSAIDEIVASARTAESIPQLQEEVIAVLRANHRVRLDASGEPDDDFQVRNLTELLNAVSATSAIMTLLLAAVASISLLVGGVGIMNIMLVSVTERTREIGLRMAVGARDGDIRSQFLVEALALSLLGGVVGVGLGGSGAYAVAVLARWPLTIPPAAIAVAVGSSVLVGVVFGFYPAWRASRLDPIEALRYE